MWDIYIYLFIYWYPLFLLIPSAAFGGILNPLNTSLYIHIYIWWYSLFDLGGVVITKVMTKIGLTTPTTISGTYVSNLVKCIFVGVLLHSLIFSLPTNCPIWPLWSVFVPTWYFTFPTTAQFWATIRCTKLQLGEFHLFCNLQNLWLLKQVHFFTKTDTVHSVLGPVQHTNCIIFTQVEEESKFFFLMKGKIKNLMEYLGNILIFQKIKSSNFIDRSTNMCPSCQGTAVFWIVEIDKEICKVRLLQQFPKAISTH